MGWHVLTPVEPLDADDLGDMVEDDRIEDIVLLDGVPYSVDDLHVCEGCNLFYTDSLEGGLCEACAEEAREEAEHIRIESAIYRRSVL